MIRVCILNELTNARTHPRTRVGVCDAFFSPEKTLELPFYASAPLRWNPPAHQAVAAAAAAATSSHATAASSSSCVLIRTPIMFSRRIGTPFVRVAEHHVALVSLPFRTARCPEAHTNHNNNHKHATRSEALEIVFLLPDSHDGLPALEVPIHVFNVLHILVDASFNYEICSLL